MESPDLSKIRRLSLGSSLLLMTLLFSGVRIESPAHISPLGVPLIIAKPNLLNRLF
jgi:hypothetical protein